MTIYYKYAVWCETESSYIETDFREDVPTSCPNNSGHSIDTDKTYVLKHFEVPYPTTVDGKPRFQETPRPFGTKTHFTSIGDNPNDPNDLSGGQYFEIIHNIDDPREQSIYLDFNCIVDINDTWIFRGAVTYQNAIHNNIVFDMVADETLTIPSGSPTNYRMYNGVILPAVMGIGDYVNIPAIVGNSIASHDGLVYAPVDDLGNSPSAYWNADWDADSTSYVNISPAPLGNGNYNMFGYEKTVVNFVNILILGSHQRIFYSRDVDQLGHGIRLKATAITRGTDHNWSMVGDLLLYRQSTV